MLMVVYNYLIMLSSYIETEIKDHWPRILTLFRNPNANLADYASLRISAKCLSPCVAPHKPPKIFLLTLAEVLIKFYIKICKLGLLSGVIVAI